MDDTLKQFKIFNPDEKTDDSKIFVIAEIGKNFIQTEEEKPLEEYVENAKKLIQAAKQTGADAVKFQTHVLEDEFLNLDIVSPHFKESDRYNWVKRNEQATPLEFWQELIKYANQLGIIFFSTPMSRRAAQKLEQIGVELWKVGSADILDFTILDFMAETGKPIIISSGMSTLKEIDKAIKFLKARTDNIVLLHCVSKYPCPVEELNLSTISFLQNRYSIPVGFSDHSLGHESALAAVQLGAKVIEKHFSFGRDLWGADHKVSMTPKEFKIMAEKIRNKEMVNLANYGRSAKILNRDEAIFRPIFRKALMAGQELKAGEVLTKEKIYAMRPQKYAQGLPSEEYENIINKELKKDLKKYEPITWEAIKNGRKRKICFVITSKIHYSRSKIILEELKNRKDVDLQLIIGASSILEKYGDITSLLEEDGFNYNAKITMTLEGGNPVAMAKTTGIGITEFATAFDNLQPDLVIVRGDRYEILSAAVAAAYLNIPLAHIEGGDVTGTIDESVRHAVTKLAHIHFATNEESKKRIIKMGENPEYVFNFGAPELEIVARNNYRVSNEFINQLGVGDVVDINEQYLMVIQHPVTSEFGHNRKNIEETLTAIYELGIPTIWFWPNVDAGTDEVSKGIRAFREKRNPKHIRFIKFIPPDEFIGLLKKSSCLIGNSSSGFKESSLLGIPVVNIGTRQNNRMRADNVIDIDYSKEEIKDAIKKQLAHGKYSPSSLYYKKDTGKLIAETLSTIDLYVQKTFHN